jgi:hypothetical protein
MPQAADILSDPEINQAYEDVRSDKSETTWLVLKVRLACLLRQFLYWFFYHEYKFARLGC